MCKTEQRIAKALAVTAYMALIFTTCMPVMSQTSAVQSAIEIEDHEEKKANVTAVYGIVADDYLPQEQVVSEELDPRRVGHQIRPSFNLPEIFYIIGIPVFFYLFFKILITFLK